MKWCSARFLFPALFLIFNELIPLLTLCTTVKLSELPARLHGRVILLFCLCFFFFFNQCDTTIKNFFFNNLLLNEPLLCLVAFKLVKQFGVPVYNYYKIQSKRKNRRLKCKHCGLDLCGKSDLGHVDAVRVLQRFTKCLTFLKVLAQTQCPGRWWSKIPWTCSHGCLYGR